jgi:hypothetical protein
MARPSAYQAPPPPGPDERQARLSAFMHISHAGLKPYCLDPTRASYRLTVANYLISCITRLIRALYRLFPLH